MKNLLQSEAMLNRYLAELSQKLGANFNTSKLSLEDELLTDQDLMKLLKISARTLYTHRKNGVFSHFKIGSKCMYFKSILLLELLNNNNDKISIPN